MSSNHRDHESQKAPDDRNVRHSRRFSDELVEDARKVFQKRTDRKLTNEDARQMLENLVGYFTVLHEWDRAQARRDVEGADRKEGSTSQIDEG